MHRTTVSAGVKKNNLLDFSGNGLRTITLTIDSALTPIAITAGEF